MFWDLFGDQGHPIRATVSEMGPLLLSRLMDLNDAQEGVLNIAFRVADEQGLLLLDMKDLRAIGGPHHDLSPGGAAGNRYAGRTQSGDRGQSGDGKI
jgi:DNA helicase HerA-like ATPase